MAKISSVSGTAAKRRENERKSVDVGMAKNNGNEKHHQNSNVQHLRRTRARCARAQLHRTRFRAPGALRAQHAALRWRNGMASAASSKMAA
jgi:hypothetical protein